MKESIIEVPTVTSQEFQSETSKLYERFRSILANKEQKVLLWHAVRRKLNRLRILDHRRTVSKKDVQRLFNELVSDGLLYQNLQAHQVDQVWRVFQKYLALKSIVMEEDMDVFSIAVSEAEKIIYPVDEKEDILLQSFVLRARKAVVFPLYRGDDIDIQIYLGCRIAFLEDDANRILYASWLKLFPQWETTTASDMHVMSVDKMREVFTLAHNPIHRRIAKVLRDRAVPYKVLAEVRARYTGAISKQDQRVPTVIQKLSEESLRSAYTTGFRTFWYILATKTAVLLPLEYTLSLLVFSHVETSHLLINLVFHPALFLFSLLFLGRIKSKWEINSDIVHARIDNIIANDPPAKIEVKPMERMHAWYIVMAIIPFVILWWVFTIIGFSFISSTFFIVLLAAILFLRARVQVKTEKYLLREVAEVGNWNQFRRHRALSWGIFIFPIIQLGKTLHDRYEKADVFIRVLDHLIEIPFRFLMRVVGRIIATLFSIVSWPLKSFFKAVARTYNFILKKIDEFIAHTRERKDDF
jgi:hypothetical protein